MTGRGGAVTGRGGAATGGGGAVTGRGGAATGGGGAVTFRTESCSRSKESSMSSCRLLISFNFAVILTNLVSKSWNVDEFFSMNNSSLLVVCEYN